MTITQKARENDQLFGSVTAKDVTEALAAKNFTIDLPPVQLEEPIQQLAEYKKSVRPHKGCDGRSDGGGVFSSVDQTGVGAGIRDWENRTPRS